MNHRQTEEYLEKHFGIDYRQAREIMRWASGKGWATVDGYTLAWTPERDYHFIEPAVGF